jgi:hypothetical protein
MANFHLYLLHTEMYISSHAPSTKRQIRVNVTRHSRNVGPHYGTWFLSHFWRLEYEGGSSTCGKFVHPWLKITKWNVTLSNQSQKEIVIHDFDINRLESNWLERFLPVTCVWEFRTLVQVLTILIILSCTSSVTACRCSDSTLNYVVMASLLVTSNSTLCNLIFTDVVR